MKTRKTRSNFLLMRGKVVGGFPEIHYSSTLRLINIHPHFISSLDGVSMLPSLNRSSTCIRSGGGRKSRKVLSSSLHNLSTSLSNITITAGRWKCYITPPPPPIEGLLTFVYHLVSLPFNRICVAIFNELSRSAPSLSITPQSALI